MRTKAHGVSIYDIAQAAKVSPSTVSRALSKPGRLSEKTETRIRGVAEQLGYFRADGMNHTSDKPSTGIVIAIIPEYDSPYYVRLIQGTRKALASHHYSLLVMSSDLVHGFERRTMAQLKETCDGFILASSFFSEPDIHRYAFDRPIVTVNRSITGLCSVSADVEDAVNEAMCVLQQSGHRTVTYMAGSSSWASELRRRSIRTAAYRYDLAYRVHRGFEADIDGGQAASEQFLSHPSDAVFTCNDQLAMGFIAAVQQAGMRVPEDVSVVSFDNNPGSGLFTPAISTIDLHPQTLGERAVDLLLKQFRSSRHQIANLTEPATFVPRDSVSHHKRVTMKLGPFVDLHQRESNVTVLTMLSSSFNETMPRIEHFMREHPNIVIDPIEGHTQESTMELYRERFTSKRSVPDLLNIEYDKMPQLAASGALLNIGTDKVEQQWGKEFNKAAWRSSHYASGLYGLPGDLSQTVMFYRQDLFKHYGLAVPVTWDQFYEEGVSLHRRNPQRYMGVIDTTDVQHYFSFFRMAGVKPWKIEDMNKVEFDLDHPYMQMTARFIKQCLDDGVLKAEPLWDGLYALPADGTYLTIVHADWFGKIIASSYPRSRGLWKVTLPPSFSDPAALKTAEIGGSMLTISSRIPRSRQHAALRFAHWFQSAPVSVDMRAMGGYSATTYFENKPDVLAQVDSYFEQRIYEIYATSAKLVNRDWDRLPFATHVNNLFKELMIPQLKPNAHSPQVLHSWQEDLNAYAQSQGFTVI